jgi:saccharopine dehydrogenase-like NADP-dependent oxidoreductase
MVEKTLRYIGHIEKMKLLKETNFFSKEKIRIGDALISPLEMTTKLLFPLWSFGEEEEDLTVMKIVASGEINKKVVKYTYDLFDKMDTKNGVSSMARTTGYTATSCARLFLEGNFREKGIIPLEYIGRNYENYLFIMKELAKRGVIFKESVN